MDARMMLWTDHQAELRQTLLSFSEHEKAIALFLQQHADLHSAQVAPGPAWFYEDEILDGLSEAQWRRIPKSEEHSIAWCIWHTTRIEDVTMNMLLAGVPQVFTTGNWATKLNIHIVDTGNDSAEEIAISESIDPDALRAYRAAVGIRTREHVSHLTPAQLKEKISPARLQDVLDVGAVKPEAQGVIDYWGGLNVARLLLMPPTRHNMTHLNEAARLKKKRT